MYWDSMPASLAIAPTIFAIAGTAVTSEEMKKIDDFQADIMDQPDIAKTKIAELSEAILNFHNQARTQRGLPQVDTNELVDESARLGLYEGMVQNADATAYEGMSNSDLFFDNGGEMDIYETIGLGEDN